MRTYCELYELCGSVKPTHPERFIFFLNIFNQNKSGHDRNMVELGLYANRINVIEMP